MRTALSVATTGLGVLFATFLAAYCLRLIGPSCAPARDPAPWLANDGAFGRPPPESPGATSARRIGDTHTRKENAP
jgi:hypothetical protein